MQISNDGKRETVDGSLQSAVGSLQSAVTSRQSAVGSLQSPVASRQLAVIGIEWLILDNFITFPRLTFAVSRLPFAISQN